MTLVSGPLSRLMARARIPHCGQVTLQTPPLYGSNKVLKLTKEIQQGPK